MPKIRRFFIVFFLLSLNFSVVKANIEIVIQIEDEIITNQDINNEKNYLKMLNPTLIQLNDLQISNLAKNSLINEVVKKKEIQKYLDFNKKNPLVENYLKNIYQKLGFTNQNQFKSKLSEENNFDLDEIKSKIKIELFWNELIYTKYKNQISIDENELKNKIQNLDDASEEEYLLSEILLSIDKKKNQNDFIKLIISSIKEIGFNNTANIYSISDSSKLGGNIGWITKSELSNSLVKEIETLKIGQHTKPIKISNNFLILKIEDSRKKNIKIDKVKELKKLIQSESDRQLNKFSRIYFNKSKKNYLISEK